MTAAGAALSAPAEDRPCTLVSISGAIEPTWVGKEPMSGLFVHGDADQLVAYQSSVLAVRLFTEKGWSAKLFTVAGAGHEITGVPPPDIVTATAGWLREHAAAHCG